MKKISLVVLTMTVIVIATLFIACKDGNSENPVVPVPKLDVPTFSHTEDTGFESNLAVSIQPGAGAPDHAVIHYTLNGEDPNEDATGSSSLYNHTDKVNLVETTPIIKAIVVADGHQTSAIATSPIFTKVDPVWDGTAVNEPSLTGSVYELYNPSELAWVAEQSVAPTSNTFSGQTIKLMDNFDMNNHLFDGITEFSGVFDGNNKTIANINIDNSADSVGFVGTLNNGTIKNLTIENGTITGIKYAGAFVGNNEGTAVLEGLVNGAGVTAIIAGGIVGHTASASNITMTNIENSGTITSNPIDSRSYAGGIIGYGVGSTTITNAKNSGNVTSYYSGGIVGHGSVNIQNAENSGDITATGYCGGIIGAAVNNEIIEIAKNTGTIKGVPAGGIVGTWYSDSGVQANKAENFGTVIGTATRNAKAGGIIGTVDAPLTISNSGNSGSLEATSNGAPFAGGIIASLTDKPITISNSYNYASLTSGTTGGMVGKVPVDGSCTITTSYYLDTSAPSIGSGTATDSSVSLSATQFASQASFVDWDFSAIWQMGTSHPTLK